MKNACRRRAFEVYCRHLTEIDGKAGMRTDMDNKTVGYTETMDYACLEDLDQVYSLRSMNPLNLYYCGRENCQPGWSFGPFVRDNYVIHVVTKGKGVYRTASGEHELARGQMFIIYPGEETSYSADEEDPWSYMWIGFNGHMAENVIREIGFLREEPVVTLDDTRQIAGGIERILASRQMTYVDAMRRSAAFFDVLACMMEHSIQENPYRFFAETKYVNKAVELIVASYTGNVRISEIADKVGVNRSYLTSIFKREMHMSPQEFLINLRLEKAAQMLRETEEQVGSIAASVGYTDALAFSKAFKQKYNETPTKFRSTRPELAQRSIRGGYEGRFRL